MIRLLLNSRDLKLQSALTAFSAPDLSVAIDSSRARVRDLVLNKKCDVVVLDVECHTDGQHFEFLEDLQELGAAVVMLTNNDPDMAIELVRRGVQSYCAKPVSIPELNMMIRKAHEYTVLKRRIEDRRVQAPSPTACGDLVGSSAGSRVVYDLIRRVASLDAFVLITGESGTGKELVARAIHSMSEREPGPFIAVSCGAIPESLIEAELFGSEKGAFTGAAGRRTGYFEEAGAGTLLLDEIGEISLHTQIKLLRVLQQREFMRLGSSAVIPLRARVLFATNRNLKQMVEEGTFREDLYYRLNVVRIHSRPLRERADDIPQLAKHFLTKYALAYRKRISAIEPDAMSLLREYAWPGNVRELENAIQSAIVLCDGHSIQYSNLPESLQREDMVCAGEALQWTSFEDQLREYKTKLAMEAVRECNGNKTLAAQSLSISRTYLHRLIREPGEDAPSLRVA